MFQQIEVENHYDLNPKDILVRNDKLFIVEWISDVKGNTPWEIAHRDEIWLYDCQEKITHVIKNPDMQKSLDRKTFKKLIA